MERASRRQNGSIACAMRIPHVPVSGNTSARRCLAVHLAPCATPKIRPPVSALRSALLASELASVGNSPVTFTFAIAPASALRLNSGPRGLEFSRLSFLLLAHTQTTTYTDTHTFFLQLCSRNARAGINCVTDMFCRARRFR